MYSLPSSFCSLFHIHVGKGLGEFMIFNKAHGCLRLKKTCYLNINSCSDLWCHTYMSGISSKTNNNNNYYYKCKSEHKSCNRLRCISGITESRVMLSSLWCDLLSSEVRLRAKSSRLCADARQWMRSVVLTVSTIFNRTRNSNIWFSHHVRRRGIVVVYVYFLLLLTVEWKYSVMLWLLLA